MGLNAGYRKGPVESWDYLCLDCKRQVAYPEVFCDDDRWESCVWPLPESVPVAKILSNSLSKDTGFVYYWCLNCWACRQIIAHNRRVDFVPPQEYRECEHCRFLTKDRIRQ